MVIHQITMLPDTLQPIEEGGAIGACCSIVIDSKDETKGVRYVRGQVMHLFRFLRTNLRFVVLGAATMIVAVGANLVVFAIVSSLWLRHRPGTEHVAMVMGDAGGLSGTTETYFFAELGLNRLRDGSTAVFEKVAGLVSTTGENADYAPRINVPSIGRPIEIAAVTWQYFSVLGLEIYGRDFTDPDDSLGAPPVAIISYDVWVDAFGKRPDVIGRVVEAEPLDLQVIGVAPKGFRGARLGEDIDLWIPRFMVPAVTGGRSQGAPPLLAIARLRPGVTSTAAERAIAGIRQGVHFSVVPLTRVFGHAGGPTRIVGGQVFIAVVAATALLVLVAGCTTLAAATFVHYERRRRELAVRMALGASKYRLVRHLIAELLWIAVPGALGAILATALGISIAPALSLADGIDFDRLNVAVDWQVAVVGGGAVVVSLALATLTPIVRASRRNIVVDLTSACLTDSSTSLRLRAIILGVHTAATTVVLIVAGLFVQTIRHGLGGTAGIDLDRTIFVQAQIRPILRKAKEAELDKELRAKAEDLVESIRNLPGIDRVTVGDAPIGPDQTAFLMAPREVRLDGRTHTLPFLFLGIGPDYFDALAVPMILGRALTAGDVISSGGAKPVVVTRALAARLTGEKPVLDLALDFGGISQYRVVGVAGEMMMGSLKSGTPYGVFHAIDIGTAVRHAALSLVVHSRVDALAAIPRIRAMVEEVFPNHSRLEVMTGRMLAMRDLGREQLGAWFFAAFGLIAMTLGVGSVYGLAA